MLSQSPGRKRKRCGVRAWAAALAAVLSLSAGARAQTAAEQLSAAAADLEKTVAAAKLSEAEAKQRADELRDVREEVAAGRLHLALYRLQTPWLLTAGQTYLASKADVKSTEAFEAEWKRLGGELGAKERRLASAAEGETPLAARALAEASSGQARPYYQSGRLYGLNTTVGDGLYYLGLAPAQLDFALFCHGLRLREGGRAPRLRPLRAELSRLEAETLAAYRRAEAAAAPSNQQQPRFNLLNSTLKLAGELDAAGLHAGALLKYLEAQLYLGLVAAPQTAADAGPGLKDKSDALGKRLRGGGTDHSLGLIFWESAQEALAGSEAEAHRRAAVIFERVLPAYFNFFGGGD